MDNAVQHSPAFSGPTMPATDSRVQHDNCVYIAICDQGHVRYVTIDGHLDQHMDPKRLMVIPLKEGSHWDQALRTLVASVLAIDEVRNIFDPETLCVNVCLYGSNRIEKSIWLKQHVQLNPDVNGSLHKQENALNDIPSMDYYRRASGLTTVTYEDVMHKVKELFDSPNVHELRQSDEFSYFWSLNFIGTVDPAVQERVIVDMRSKGWNVVWGSVSREGHDLIIGMPKRV
jgi:hypothetical protein